MRDRTFFVGCEACPTEDGRVALMRDFLGSTPSCDGRRSALIPGHVMHITVERIGGVGPWRV
jgi:hypothetical protein